LHKIGIIQFPGSNTERETFMACERVGMEPIEVLWNSSQKILSDMVGYIIIGGFSYEDRSRAGVIAALDPIIQQIKIESEKGKPVLGICNGAQILVESGLVPGLQDYSIGVALTDNKRIVDGQVVGVGYYNTWTNLKLSTKPERCAFTRHSDPKILMNIPLAHGEGRFVMPNGLLDQLIKNEQLVYKYSNDSGDIIDEFPTNPNGSVNNIAAISNSSGNVMAMMPHPERTTNGDAIFSSMKEYIDENYPTINQPLSFSTTNHKSKELNIDHKSTEWVIDLIITDNEARSVNTALNHLGFDIEVNRQIHWEINIDGEPTNVLNKIIDSGELFNSNKEYIVDKKGKYDASFLVRPNEDIYGRAKYESLTNRFDIKEISYIKRGVIWNINSKRGNLNDEINSILTTNIFFNPHCYEYYEIKK